MHFLHLNARLLLPKISELKLIAEKTRATAFSVTETWLGSSVTDQEFSIDNYCVARKDRSRKTEAEFVHIYARMLLSVSKMSFQEIRKKSSGLNFTNLSLSQLSLGHVINRKSKTTL